MTTAEATRQLKYLQAIREATDLCMEADARVQIMGLGVPDPKGIFGTTLGLQAKYGSERVSDLPTSENAMAGVAIGCALAGMRPIVTHHRLDFALLAMEPLINQAAKWHYMFGGRARVPLVVRMLVGRGWGQGPQHSQSLQAWFAHVPGLKVVMATTPYDVKGLLIASIEDDNPVVFIEHRWLYNLSGAVPEGLYRVPIGRARVMREGSDLTIVATSYMAVEALRAAAWLGDHGIGVEVVDVRSLRPWDDTTILDSVARTRRVIVTDTGWATVGFSAEVVARIAEQGIPLATPPRRVCLPDCPTPTSPALAAHYYPRAIDLVRVASRMLDVALPEWRDIPLAHLDVPDPSFTGPF
ncbi:MAG: transketolase C-terminal domain-containing protein [Acidobacteriota bacterium]